MCFWFLPSNVNIYQNIYSNMFMYTDVDTESHRNSKNTQFITQNTPITPIHETSFPKTIFSSKQTFQKFRIVCLSSWFYQHLIYLNNKYCLGSPTGIILFQNVNRTSILQLSLQFSSPWWRTRGGQLTTPPRELPLSNT